jgi:hypothetical protein
MQRIGSIKEEMIKSESSIEGWIARVRESIEK